MGKSVACVHLKVAGVEDLFINTNTSEFSMCENIVLQQWVWYPVPSPIQPKTLESVIMKIQTPKCQPPLSVFQNTSCMGCGGQGSSGQAVSWSANDSHTAAWRMRRRQQSVSVLSAEGIQEGLCELSRAQHPILRGRIFCNINIAPTSAFCPVLGAFTSSSLCRIISHLFCPEKKHDSKRPIKGMFSWL